MLSSIFKSFQPFSNDFNRLKPISALFTRFNHFQSGEEKNCLRASWRQCYYPHPSRDLVSPVCGIYFSSFFRLSGWQAKIFILGKISFALWLGEKKSCSRQRKTRMWKTEQKSLKQSSNAQISRRKKDTKRGEEGSEYEEEDSCWCWQKYWTGPSAVNLGGTGTKN